MFWFNLRNIKKVGVTHGTGAAVLFFGKTFVVSTTTLICFFIIEEAPYFKKLGVSSTYAIHTRFIHGVSMCTYEDAQGRVLLGRNIPGGVCVMRIGVGGGLFNQH
jgi:hypothetical protein